MKLTLILHAILALGIAFSTPKVEALNARALLWVCGTTLSVLSTYGNVNIIFDRKTRTEIVEKFREIGIKFENNTKNFAKIAICSAAATIFCGVQCGRALFSPVR